MGKFISNVFNKNNKNVILRFFALEMKTLEGSEKEVVGFERKRSSQTFRKRRHKKAGTSRFPL